MKVDLSRVQEATQVEDSDGSCQEDPPEWDSRSEPFDEYWEHAQRYTHRPNQEWPRRSASSLSSPFLKPTRPTGVPCPRQDGERNFRASRTMCFSFCVLCFSEFCGLSAWTYRCTPERSRQARETKTSHDDYASPVSTG
jgi:hypothetical protein